VAQPAAGCLHGRDRHADHAAAGNGGTVVRRKRQYDHRPGGAALSPHREGRARPYRRRGPGGQETLFNPSLYAADGTFIARPDGWWPDLGIAIEVDSLEWHLSPQDHADTLARGRRMARYQIIVLRFTPRQLRTDPATVIRDIKEALKGARGRPPLAKLQTVPAESDKPDASNTNASNADASEDTGQPFREPAAVA
jgi:hypothetical protein